MNRKLVVVSIVLLLLPILQYFGFTCAGPIDETVSITRSSVGSTQYVWPMFRHDPSHTGYTSSPGPATNQTLWIYETPFDIWGPSPVVVNGTLYIGGGFGTILYALNASTGESMWNYTTWAWIASTPAVAYGMVYFGSFNTNITALDAATGALMWNYTTGAWLAASSPCVVDGVVYIGGGYGNSVYALNATTGLKIWNYTVGDWVHSSPAVADGVVYVGSYDDNVYALNASTGDLIWSYTTGFDVFSSPAVVGGIVYIGSNDNNVYALNASTGALIWNYTTGGWVASSPAVADGVVYIGSYDNNVYALNASTGALIWNYSTGGAVSSSPAVAGGVIYIGTGDPANKTYALNASTGEMIWSYKTGGDVWGSPAVANGIVYTASRDGNVYAFGTAPNIAVKNVTPIPTTVTVGDSVTVTVEVTNDGILTQTFDVTVYYDTTEIGTQTIANLAPKTSKELNFNWNTLGLDPGNYTIKATASTVPGEINTADNIFIGGKVRIQARAEKEAPPDIVPYAVAGIVIVAIVVMAFYFQKVRKRREA